MVTKQTETHLNAMEVLNLITFLRDEWNPGGSLTIIQESSGIGVRTDVRSGKHKEDITDYDCW